MLFILCICTCSDFLVGKNQQEIDKEAGEKAKGKKARLESNIGDGVSDVRLFSLLNKYLVKPLLSK